MTDGVYTKINVFDFDNRVALALEDEEGFPLAIWLTYNAAEKLLGDLRIVVKKHKEMVR
jgi:hypothetical protein